MSEEPLDHLLILRGFACSAVFFSHLIATTGLIARLPPFAQLEGFPAVWFFYMHSSFLLSKGFLRGRFGMDEQGVRFFFKTRAFRLLPLLFTVQIALLLLNHAVQGPPPLTIAGWKRELFLLTLGPWTHYYYGGAIGSLNSPVWSVLLEIDFVLILPMLMRLMKLSVHTINGLLAIWWLTLLRLSIRVALKHASVPMIWSHVYESHIYNCGFFLAGMSIAYYKSKWDIPLNGRLIPVTSFLCFAGYAALNHIGHYSLDRALLYGPVFLLPLYTFLILAVNSEYQRHLPRSANELVNRWSVLGVAESMGVMSYSVYLCHRYPMNVLFIYFQRAGLNMWLIHSAIAAILLIIPGVLFFSIENKYRLKTAS